MFEFCFITVSAFVFCTRCDLFNELVIHSHQLMNFCFQSKHVSLFECDVKFYLSANIGVDEYISLQIKGVSGFSAQSPWTFVLRDIFHLLMLPCHKP